jgi:TonB-dependent SusC/RagA subfamily outer membrane receptor
VVGRGKYESKDEIDSFPKASGKKKIVKPLIIIDGKESDNGIEQISTDDIESISVLKDEYSVRVYGERGRAGVVVITMKKSENGDRIISIE